LQQALDLRRPRAPQKQGTIAAADEGEISELVDARRCWHSEVIRQVEWGLVGYYGRQRGVSLRSCCAAKYQETQGERGECRPDTRD
jgi:hypothetical protein